MRRSMMGRKKLQLFTKRFYPAGNYTWIVPKGCREVDVFLVGAGGGSYHVTSMGCPVAEEVDIPKPTVEKAMLNPLPVHG